MEADEAGEVYQVSPVEVQIFFVSSQICPYDFAFRLAHRGRHLRQQQANKNSLAVHAGRWVEILRAITGEHIRKIIEHNAQYQANSSREDENKRHPSPALAARRAQARHAAGPGTQLD